MKKLIRFIMPVKTLAAMIFAGLMCAYVVAGALYGLIVYPGFEYTFPFIIVIQGVITKNGEYRGAGIPLFCEVLDSFRVYSMNKI